MFSALAGEFLEDWLDVEDTEFDRGDVAVLAIGFLVAT